MVWFRLALFGFGAYRKVRKWRKRRARGKAKP